MGALTKCVLSPFVVRFTTSASEERGYSLQKTHQRARTRQRRAHERELLELAWEALNAARENKALTLVEGWHSHRRQRACPGAVRVPVETLHGLAVAELLDFIPSDVERWETDLNTPAGVRISVEVTRQTLSARIPTVQVYTIRDLRARRAAAGQFRRCLLAHS
jgi:hypothetical protein